MTMQAIGSAIAALYARHEGVCNLFAVAAVVNMPRPGAKSVAYRWLFSTLQSFMGALKPHAEREIEQNIPPSVDPDVPGPDPDPTQAHQ